MTNPIAQVNTIRFKPPDEEDYVPAYKEVRLLCPGCNSAHDFTIEVLDARYTRRDGSPEPVWDWNGDLEKPTFSPSMLAYSSVHLCMGEHRYEECVEDCTSYSLLWKTPDGELHNVPYRDTPPENAVEVHAHDVTGHTKDPAWGNCHSFLRDGVWQFLSDCAHEHKNEFMPVIPLKNWMVREHSND